MTRDPGWESRGDPLAHATESLTSQAASDNPLSALSIREALVFLARSRSLPMAEVAKALKGDRHDGSLSRETTYLALRRATAVLEGMRRDPTRRPVKPPPRCACGQLRSLGRRRCKDCWRDHQREVMRVRRVIESGPDRA